MNSVIFFTIPEITSYIVDFLNIIDMENLRLVNKDFAETFEYEHKRKLKGFKHSLNYRNIFARPYYPLSKLKEIYQEEAKKYIDGQRIAVFWNKQNVGFVRYKTGYESIPNCWNGYFFQKEIKYDEDTYPTNSIKYKGCNLQAITYVQGNILGFDHSHYWDFQEKNYTTLEMVKNEVIAMYLYYNELIPFPEYNL